MKQVLQNDEINKALRDNGWTKGASEGRLMLAELLLKASAGYYNSHTEEGFLNSFKMLRADRTINRKGAKYLCSLFYSDSNKRPEGLDLMIKYRN